MHNTTILPIDLQAFDPTYDGGAGAAAVPAFAQREDVAGLSDAEVRAVLGRVERRERVSFG